MDYPFNVEETIILLFVAFRICLAFLGCGEEVRFHWDDFCLVSGSYP